ncbi:MAG: T9SS type A sorting domain-containing protein [Ignavibacteriales bacterium]|nr:T9SS type A sorting domain-containing protein [Ignavibacteriales bacterium]
MKKWYAFFLVVVLLPLPLLGQTYPTVSIRQVQEIPDSVLNGTNPITDSPFLGDTVWVRGVVVTAPRYQNGAPLWFTGDRWRFVLRDPSESLFHHITVVASDTTFFRDSVGLDLLVEGDSVEILGYITEFRQLTQLEVVKKRDILNLLGTSSASFNATVLPVSSFFTGTTRKYNPAEKYESGFVRLEDLKVITISGDEFIVSDANDNQIIVDDQSNQINPGRPDSLIPPVGATINWVQGYIFTNSALNWTINPRFPADYEVGTIFPPTISNVARLDTLPGPGTNIRIQARILDQDGTVQNAEVYYSVNGTPKGFLGMTSGADSIWSATIPAVGMDSALVTYYIVAGDNGNNTSVFPGDTNIVRNFFFVLNRNPRIAEIQYNPYGGASSYLGAKLSVSGTATTDRTIYGAVFIQEASAVWSGIRVQSSQDTSVRIGQNITVLGTVAENFGQTVLNNATLTINSQGNPLPSPVNVLTTDVRTRGTFPEAYESVLLQVQNVYVVNLNEDSPSNANFGEFGIHENNTATSGLRVDDFSLRLPYSNDTTRPNQSGKIQLRKGDFFQSLRGILDYSFNNYKLIPRDSADFTGYQATTSVEITNEQTPSSFVLSQNYPNPFNPSTTIEYSIVSTGPVSLKVYNLLGQEIGTIFNGVQGPGTYKVHLDKDFFRGAASGFYLYQLRAGDFLETKKMLLLR